MIDVVLLLLVCAAATSGGLACLRALRAAPAVDEALLVGGAVGLGLLGVVGLGLAAAGALRPLPIALVGLLALVAGGRELGAAIAAARGMLRRPRSALTALLLVACAVVLATEVVAMLAPAVGGDQTKYHLPYPRLYAASGGLVDTPWTFWGQMQFLQNFAYAIAFALRGDVLARLLNGVSGVLAACALGRLVERHLARGLGVAAGALFFTLPITWSMMSRAGNDLPVILYGALATDAALTWAKTDAGADLRRTAILAGLGGGSKSMGLLVPALVGLVVLVELVRRATARRALRDALVYGLLALAFTSPCYVRNAVETGNPLYPFGYAVFGGRNWSRAASDYLSLYYSQYRTRWAGRRGDDAYAGLEVVRFPWDLTMHPDSFEKSARQAYDVSPFALAFLPALGLVGRRRVGVLVTAAIGLGYAGIIAGGAWAHPRYVVPGVALLLVATVPAARALLGRRAFAVVLGLTIAGNVALTGRLLQPLWRGQLAVVLGRLDPAEFLRKQEPRYAFWERANAAVPAAGRVLVLEKIPHPYYIERPFVLASYLEQGLIDYRRVDTPAALAARAANLGITHVAVDIAGLDAAADPYEAGVAKLWRAFLDADCDPVLREDDFALLTLKTPSAYAAGQGVPRG